MAMISPGASAPSCLCLDTKLQSESGFEPRSFLVVDRLAFDSRRRVLEARVGRVAMRRFGRWAALRRSATSFWSAISRLRSCERVSCAVITNTPSLVSNLPAMGCSRCFRSSGRKARATSKRSSAAVETLLTFCPPGPEAREKAQTISSSSMDTESVIRIMAKASRPLRLTAQERQIKRNRACLCGGMVDAADSKSVVCKNMPVQVWPGVPFFLRKFLSNAPVAQLDRVHDYGS